MAFEFKPEPTDEERAAILAALAAEEEPPESAWADAVLPPTPEELE